MTSSNTSRRGFIGALALSGAALGASRVELVGAAHLGVDDETLARLTRLTREGFGERFGARVFARAEDLLDATRPELVLVAAPNLEKARYVAMALGAGADVYVSKPMASTVEDAAQIREAARRHPQRLAGALNPARFATAIREATSPAWAPPMPSATANSGAREK